MLDTQKIIEESARALYAAHHWRNMITETANARLSQEAYEQRAKDRWDAGEAGEFNYSDYRRLSEIAFPIFRDAIVTDYSFSIPSIFAAPQELAKAS